MKELYLGCVFDVGPKRHFALEVNRRRHFARDAR